MAEVHLARAQFHTMCRRHEGRLGVHQQGDEAVHRRAARPRARAPAMLEGDCGGFAIDRLEHCLQTATRAHRDGRDEEYVVCALLHDMGDILGPRNHADVARRDPEAVRVRAEPLDGREARDLPGLLLLPSPRPRPQHARAVPRPSLVRCHRGILPRCTTARRSIRSFVSMPLEEFEPMVRRVFSNVKNSIYVPKAAPAPF